MPLCLVGVETNPRLAVKTLVPDHNCYRIFINPKVTSKFLAKLYKNIILDENDYKIKVPK